MDDAFVNGLCSCRVADVADPPSDRGLDLFRLRADDLSCSRRPDSCARLVRPPRQSGGRSREVLSPGPGEVVCAGKSRVDLGL